MDIEKFNSNVDISSFGRNNLDDLGNCLHLLFSSSTVHEELYNDISRINDNDNACAISVEILEENNNNPNNILDSTETLQQQTNVILSSQSDTCEINSVKSLENLSLNDYDDDWIAEMKEKAHLICTLLPMYKYNRVLGILYKNRYAMNCLELSLWDLLPMKRPKISYIIKTDNNLNSSLNIQNTSSNSDTQNKKIISKMRDTDNKSLKSSTRNKVLINNSKSYKEQMLYDYMQYLSSMQNVKKEKLYIAVDYKKEQELKQSIDRNEDISEPTNTEEYLDIDSNNKKDDINYSLSSNISSTENILSNISCSNVTLYDTTTNDVSEIVVPSQDITAQKIVKPLTSTGNYSVQNINCVFGGTRKKEINFKKKISRNIKDTEEYTRSPLNNIQLHKRLELIFPDLDKNYINKICKRYLNRDADLDKQFEELINIIVGDRKLCPTKTIMKELYQEENYIDGKFMYLTGIFPNADPIYLKKVVTQIGNDSVKLNHFVESQWEHPTYLTRDEKIKRIRITEHQKQHIKKFDVKKFLEIYPDPFKYFENPERKSEYNSDAFEFLKSHFNKFEVCILQYNMYLWYIKHCLKFIDNNFNKCL